MREIKFRAWDKDRKVMANVSNIDFLTGQVQMNAGGMHSERFSGDKVILLQYTGLKDATGVEIYEGDIIVWKYSEKPQEVFWDSSISGFSTKHYHLWRAVKKVEIIGNIYENPELLEGLR